MKCWVLAVLVLLGLALPACGGSSSETPFPLEPDSRYLNSDGGPPANARYVTFSGAGVKRDGGGDAKSPDDEDEPE